MNRDSTRKPRFPAMTERFRRTVLAATLLILLLTACQDPGSGFRKESVRWGHSIWNTATWQ